MSTEVWKPVPGYEGAYEVSDHGRVRSLDRKIATCPKGTAYRRLVRGRVLATSAHPGGYRLVHLWQDGRVRATTVHALVAAAFLGPCPSGQEVRHKNGVAGGHGLANLEYGTRKENHADKRRHGTHLQGETQNGAVLTEPEVRAIRAARGATHQALADRFGCSRRNIGRILSRELWRHVA